MRRQRLELYELPDYVPRKNKSNDYGFDPHEQEHETYHRHGRRHQRARPVGVRVDGRDPGPHPRASRPVRQGDQRLPAHAAAGDRRGEERRPAADGARCASGAEAHRPRRDRRHRPDRRLAGLLAAGPTRASARPRAGRTAGDEPQRAAERHTMPPRKSAQAPHFVERHELWSDEQRRAAAAVEREIKRRKLELVRFSFADQHGMLRGKTLVASEAARAMRTGVTMTSTLLAKDTSHRTVFPVFTAGGGLGIAEMEGAGNFVMVADPATFRVLPWADNTGWVLCDIYFPNGKPVPFSTRALYRDALASCWRTRASTISPASRSSSSCSSSTIRGSRPKALTWPAEAPAVEPHHARLPVSHRGALRSGRSDARGAAQDHAGARPAAALARGGARPEPVRVHLRARERARGRRHHGAVPQRDEAGGAAARLSRELHVPAAIAQRVRQRLASASVAARREDRGRTRSSRTIGASCCRRSAARSSPACWRMRARPRRSRRRRSTATSAITASTRWRRSRRSGRATTAA